MNLRRSLLGVLTILPLASAGCLLPFGPRDVRMEVCRTAGVKLNPDLTITTDGLTLTALSGLIPMRVPVWHIAWLSFGMYTVEGAEGDQDRAQFGRLELPGWERIARIFEDGSETLVYVQAGDRPLRAMAVLVKEDDQLIIAKMIGRLDRLLEDTVGPGGWGALTATPLGTAPPTISTSEDQPTACSTSRSWRFFRAAPVRKRCRFVPPKRSLIRPACGGQASADGSDRKNVVDSETLH